MHFILSNYFFSAGFFPAGAADEEDSRVRIPATRRLRERDPREQMATGSSPRDHHPKSHPDSRESASSTPTAVMAPSIADPP